MNTLSKATATIPTMEFASNTTASRSFHLDLSLHTNQNIPFPWKLHEMLDACEKEGWSHIVSWLPDNASFRVHNPTFFMENVIRNFFKQTKYKSFQRQLNIWGFQRIISGPNKGGYSHKYFIRSNESLCCMMSRQKIKGEKRAKPRPYFPFKAITCGGKNRVDSIRNLTSIQDQALNIMLGKDLFPLTRNCEGTMKNDMASLFSNMPAEAPCLTRLPSDSMDGSGQGHSSSNLGDTTGTVSPRGVLSLPSSPRSKRSLSPLNFAEHCMAPLLDGDLNDENMNSNLMQCLSPDPIAPDHPLSKKNKDNFNQAIGSTIDALVQDDYSFF